MRYCRNWRTIGQGRQISYQNNDGHLKKEENLVVLD